MSGRALSLEEREVIAVGIAAGRSAIETARELGRDPSTVRREIARHGGPEKYSVVAADRRACRSRRRPKQSRLEADPALAGYVAQRLALRDSPMTIAIELERGIHGMTALISHECIYQAIYQRRGLDAGARTGLHLRRRKRKHRNTQRPLAHSLQGFRPISERPAIAFERVEAGHFEGDLITGAYNRSAMITIFDRASRRLWLVGVANKSANAVHAALVRTLLSVPARQRRTLTWDQGSELARHRDLEKACGIKVYIADKNSPWQRPTNENGNAFVRRYVGKGTDLNNISNHRRRWIEHRINTTPRRSLGWDTANTVYDRLSAPTP
ncbi:IS30 family transposase [Ilumatobacter sp.]|uniref:IS30 family transposase n=1 Tax=Ilumatobacter sp. TaxID=1967498 RepID=UPI003C59DABE